MAIRQFFIAVENVALTNPQRATFVSVLQALGPNNDVSPRRRNHWRTRLDGQALILEAEFDDSLLTVAQFKSRLASIFGVAVGSITHTTSNPASGVLLTFLYQSVARVRILLFGGATATYQESYQAVLSYLSANQAAWDEDM